MKNITIRGARTHNLQNINLEIPRDKLVVITGLSGSGKSSLAFDTLYAEGQRRYVESLSTYARQFLSVMEKPDVDLIEGLSPAIAIEQKSTSHNPRSTVGTVTEIYDYLRLLFARVGKPVCPKHNLELSAQSISQMVDQILALPANSKFLILAPIIKDRRGEHRDKLKELSKLGYLRVRIDGEIFELDALPTIDGKKKHSIEVVVDRLKVNLSNRARITDSIETALGLANDIVTIYLPDEENELAFSAKFACPHCGWALSELEPRLFSFNSPIGACSDCDGIGVMQFMDPDKVIYNPKLSLSSGAIRGWDRNHNYYYSMLESLAKHYNFSLTAPFGTLTKKNQNIILYGSGDEIITFSFKFDAHRVKRKKQVFPGILPYMERRYKETDSDLVREELARHLSQQPCSTCNGTRLCIAARQVFIQEMSLPDVAKLSILEARNFLAKIKFNDFRAKIAKKILKELHSRLGFLLDVGLEYLSLDRTADTLSGGEAQRIRLASQIGAGLVGVMYVLDEPSIGLHQRDNARLLNTLKQLRDLGNSVIVVEHDEDAILNANFVVDIGPEAGTAGGKVIAKGSPKDIMRCTKSLTGKYLSGKEYIAVPTKRQAANGNSIIIHKACENNLKDITIEIPLGIMTCITGVSGSGKSSLINDTLYPHAAEKLNNAKLISVGKAAKITGLENLDKVIDITQAPIGRTPRSNAATYTGLFTEIRDLFAKTEEARARGYQVGRFSFNVKGGRCESCRGDGVLKVEMHFLADIYVVCDICHGKRYNTETLEVHYKGKNIHEVLEMTVTEATDFFRAIPAITRKLITLAEVGLGYLKLGQSATTLSGGEAQRIKLAKELSKRDTGKTLYILDEPTTGLHFHDIKRLLHVLDKLKHKGNTIVIIEHNLDVIKTADWIIDLGPEGGDKGGNIVAIGTPEQISKVAKSHTGKFLKPLLKK